MKDARVEKLAELLVHYSLELKKGQWFQIEGAVSAAPLVRAVYEQALKAGAYPMTHLYLEDLDEVLYRHGNDDQLKFIPEVRRLEVEKLDAKLTIMGNINTKTLSNVDPARMAMRRTAAGPISKIFLQRMASDALRWCGTLYPNSGNAQDAEMSLAEYEEFVYRAGLLHKADPVAEWKRISTEQERIVRFLNQRKEFHVTGPDTDLRFKTAGRSWVNCNGQVNFPDGEVFTGPIENTMEGAVRYTYPAVYGGREVQDVRLEFRGGEVVRASASRGEDYLKSMIGLDDGARRVGEFAIGTNYDIQRFTRNTLFDEKIGGTFHMALGASLPQTGGTNDSALHWDMVCDLRQGGEIHADGELIYEKGRFVI
jgi:aminopeptidase